MTSVSINRIRLEFKACRFREKDERQICINRIRLEFKAQKVKGQ